MGARAWAEELPQEAPEIVSGSSLTPLQEAAISLGGYPPVLPGEAKGRSQKKVLQATAKAGRAAASCGAVREGWHGHGDKRNRQQGLGSFSVLLEAAEGVAGGTTNSAVLIEGTREKRW